MNNIFFNKTSINRVSQKKNNAIVMCINLCFICVKNQIYMALYIIGHEKVNTNVMDTKLHNANNIHWYMIL